MFPCIDFDIPYTLIRITLTFKGPIENKREHH